MMLGDDFPEKPEEDTRRTWRSRAVVLTEVPQCLEDSRAQCDLGKVG
jgi:hypothetical protein